MSDDECHPEFTDEDKNWHILSGDHRSGPYRFCDLMRAVNQQIVKNNDFVWHPQWSDWRQVKSVPSLAATFSPDFVDYENHGGSALVRPMTVLVSKFELKLRPTLASRSRLKLIVLDDRLIYIADTILIGITIFALGALSVLIFGNDRYGAAYVVIEFTTLLLLCIAVAHRAGMLGFSTLRFCVLSALSGLLLVVMNLDRLPDALDAWQGRRLLATVRTSEQALRVALKSPENKFVQLISASYDATRQTLAATTQLIKDLEPHGLTFDAVRGATSRDQLMESATELRVAEARAALALPRYFSILESERGDVEQAGRRIYADDPYHLLPRYMAALGRRQEHLRERMGRTFQAIGAYYSAMGDAAEFVAQHWDQFRAARISKVSFTAADQGTNAQYNRLMTSVRAAQAVVAVLDRENRKYNADLKSLWTDAAKVP